MNINGKTIVQWGAIAGAVVAISAGVSLFEDLVGDPPFANAGSLEEVQRSVILLKIDVLNQAYDRLLAQQNAFLVAGKPVPQSLLEQIRDKCRQIRGAGGSC